MIAQTFRSKPDRSSAFTYKKGIDAGFPSPVLSNPGERLNLNDYVVKHPVSTFFIQISGGGKNRLGLKDGDILVIDRSLAPRHDSLVIADLDGELSVCRLHKNGNSWTLEESDGNLISVSFSSDFQSPVWGKVTHVIQSV